MSRRRILAVLALVVLGVLAAPAIAHGASDLYYNSGPGDPVGPLADRYPLGAYDLDQHFSMVKASLTGGVDASGIGPGIAGFFADMIWQVTAFLVYSVIQLFSLAFSIDLVNGSPQTGGAGALAPVSDAIHNLYANTLGAPWMEAAVVVAGCWAMWRALVQRRYSETAAGLGMSVIYVVIALAIVFNTDATIGRATQWDNRIADAFLSVSIHGKVTTGPDAHRQASDELFDVLVLRPWVALEFGGTQHCIKIGTGSTDHDPISVPVLPLAADPAADAHARARLHRDGHVTAAGKECIDNSLRYPQHFLAFAPGSPDRDAEYDAINNADPSKLPDSDPEKNTYNPAVADKPATDAMEKGGQYQRLLLAIVVLVGELGSVLLLGTLAISILLAQMVVLLLAAFSVVALIAAIVPGRGHALFKNWASQLGTYLVRKAVYALVLTILLTVVAALQDATTNMGWLFSFGCQSMFMWMVFLGRQKLAGSIIAAVSGHEPQREAHLKKLLGAGFVGYRLAKLAKPPARPRRDQAPVDHRPPPVEPELAPVPAPRVAEPSPRIHQRPTARRDHGGARPARDESAPIDREADEETAPRRPVTRPSGHAEREQTDTAQTSSPRPRRKRHDAKRPPSNPPPPSRRPSLRPRPDDAGRPTETS
ncbi:hypothetical protein [Conexibacter woesei]|uniref:hypothetical protein n=1 Tax=Conexibacter woesei TaxID=191495 RepID=UPI00041A756C|nr:hypothetical protein [Conexibacter woesei]